MNGASTRSLPYADHQPQVRETEHLIRRQRLVGTDHDLHKVPIVNQYAMQELVGSGQHGKVHRAWDSQAKIHVAIKKVPREQKSDKIRLLRQQPLPSSQHTAVAGRILTSEQKILREIAIMKHCQHANVVRLLEVINDPLAKKIYIVMEYLGGGEIKWRNDLNEPILTVDQTRRILRDAILGLEYLHFQGIIHRDIKPANLLWTEDRSQVKIADFGVSHLSFAQRIAGARANDSEAILFDEAELSKKAGTPSFLAPEVICDLTLEDEDSSGEWQNGSFGSASESRRPPITKAIDIWALGATMYCLLFGRTPFDPDPDPDMHPAARETRLYRAILHNDWAVDQRMGSDGIPTGGRRPKETIPHTEGFIVIHLLDHLMQKDVYRRMQLSEIKKYIWFTRDLSNAHDWLKTSYPGAPLTAIAPSESEVQKPFSEVHFKWQEQLSRIFRPFRPLRQTSQRLRKPDPVDTFGTKSDPSKDIIRHRSSPSAPPTRKQKPNAKYQSPQVKRSSWDKDKFGPKAASASLRIKTSSSPNKYNRRNKSMDRYLPSDKTAKAESCLTPPPSKRNRRGSETFLAPPGSSGTSSQPSPVEERPRSRIAALWNWLPRSAGSNTPSSSQSMRREQQRSSWKGKQPAMDAVVKSEEALYNRYSIETPPEPSNNLSVERRASSWADNAKDYADVRSVKSEFSEPDEQVIFVGAGGVSNEVPFFRRQQLRSSPSSSSNDGGVLTPTTTVSPSANILLGKPSTIVSSIVDPGHMAESRTQTCRTMGNSSPLAKVIYDGGKFSYNPSSSPSTGLVVDDQNDILEDEDLGIDTDSSGSSDLGSVRGRPFDFDDKSDEDDDDDDVDDVDGGNGEESDNSDDVIEIHTGRHRAISQPLPESPPPSPPPK